MSISAGTILFFFLYQAKPSANRANIRSFFNIQRLAQSFTVGTEDHTVFRWIKLFVSVFHNVRRHLRVPCTKVVGTLIYNHSISKYCEDKKVLFFNSLLIQGFIAFFTLCGLSFRRI